VFDSVGGNSLQRGFRVLRPGGKLVGLSNHGIKNLLLDLTKAFVLNWLPNGKSAEWYGITPMYRKDKGLFFQDLQILFQLLEQGQIKPIIAAKLPLLEARQAHELLESGRISGKIVLLSPELLEK
jgi:NADPH:quinone reductase